MAVLTNSVSNGARRYFSSAMAGMGLTYMWWLWFLSALLWCLTLLMCWNLGDGEIYPLVCFLCGPSHVERASPVPGMPGEYVYQSMTACEADFWGNGRGLWSGFGFRDGLECWKKFNCCKGRTNISLPSHIHHEEFWEKLEDFIFFLHEWFWDSLHSSDSNPGWYIATIPYQLLGTNVQGRGWHSHRLHFSCAATKGPVVGWRWKKRLTHRKDVLICWVLGHKGSSVIS